jgi:hypothetical protein
MQFKHTSKVSSLLAILPQQDLKDIGFAR